MEHNDNQNVDSRYMDPDLYKNPKHYTT
jgi:serine/threonine protein kinase